MLARWCCGSDCLEVDEVEEEAAAEGGELSINGGTSSHSSKGMFGSSQKGSSGKLVLSSICPFSSEGCGVSCTSI